MCRKVVTWVTGSSCIIITQEFHLPRAVYIARRMGLNAYGIVADKRNYSTDYLSGREIFANVKAFLELTIKAKPTYLGEKIPITGNSIESYD